METWTIVARLELALALGGLVGWERERESEPAGLRTLILVSTGSALFVLVTQAVANAATSVDDIDVVRIIAGITQGIGFLGASTVFITRGTVQGLTAAAAVWATSAVGVACGFWEWEIALVGTALARRPAAGAALAQVGVVGPINDLPRPRSAATLLSLEKSPRLQEQHRPGGCILPARSSPATCGA